MNLRIIIRVFLVFASSFVPVALLAQDPLADNMLLYQRSIGGWPKHINDVKVDYTKSLSESEKVSVLKDKVRNDATIDNQATIKEIRHLLKAYKTTGNKAYLTSAENGIRYLLMMQKDNGGFPQFYPDSSSYRGQITYNDNAMINALNVLWDVAHGTAGFEVVDASLKAPAAAGVEKGIQCILKTQIVVNGKRTGWCAQHDKKTLQPVKARSFELVSISGMESDGIVEFLMKVENPSEEIIQSICCAMQWFISSRIEGYKYVDITDATQPNGRDRVLVPDSSSAVWARFYDIETGKPFFSGRDGQKKWNLMEIENERRTGYAWYGTWPENLLKKTYPKWKTRNGIK
jgi:PelA/Pel-15E family pectate lyase